MSSLIRTQSSERVRKSAVNSTCFMFRFLLFTTERPPTWPWVLSGILGILALLAVSSGIVMCYRYKRMKSPAGMMTLCLCVLLFGLLL